MITRLLPVAVLLCLLFCSGEDSTNNDPTGPGTGTGERVEIDFEHVGWGISIAVDSVSKTATVEGVVRNPHASDTLKAPFYVVAALMVEVTSGLDTVGTQEILISKTLAPRDTTQWSAQFTSSTYDLWYFHTNGKLVALASAYHLQ